MANNKRPTQASRIVQYMKDFGSITQFQTLQDLGCLRLASRISELKEVGRMPLSCFYFVIARSEATKQ